MPQSNRWAVGQKRARAPILKWRPGASVSAALVEVSDGAFDDNAGVEGTRNGEEAVVDIVAIRFDHIPTNSFTQIGQNKRYTALKWRSFRRCLTPTGKSQSQLVVQQLYNSPEV